MIIREHIAPLVSKLPCAHVSPPRECEHCTYLLDLGVVQERHCMVDGNIAVDSGKNEIADKDFDI